jgi:hypothetical protein
MRKHHGMPEVAIAPIVAVHARSLTAFPPVPSSISFQASKNAGVRCFASASDVHLCGCRRCPVGRFVREFRHALQLWKAFLRQATAGTCVSCVLRYWLQCVKILPQVRSVVFCGRCRETVCAEPVESADVCRSCTSRGVLLYQPETRDAASDDRPSHSPGTVWWSVLCGAGGVVSGILKLHQHFH